jgi:hypothetical protein
MNPGKIARRSFLLPFDLHCHFSANEVNLSLACMKVNFKASTQMLADHSLDQLSQIGPKVENPGKGLVDKRIREIDFPLLPVKGNFLSEIELVIVPNDRVPP